MDTTNPKTLGLEQFMYVCNKSITFPGRMRVVRVAEDELRRTSCGGFTVWVDQGGNGRKRVRLSW